MKVYAGVLFLFAIYLTFWVEQNYSDYSNDAGYCTNYSYYTTCVITNNDTQSIKSLLSNGSQGTEYRLNVYKRYSLNSGSLTLDLEIPPNIRDLYLYLSYSNNLEQIILSASSINTAIEYMYCDRPVLLESQNFFNQFVGLIRITFSDLLSTNWPSFSKLDSLIYLTARIIIGGNQVLDSSYFNDLSNLGSLDLSYSSFASIMEGTFDNMDSLYYLYLDNNQISSLQDGALSGLTYLRYLSLEDNGLRDVSYDIFRDLNQLTYLNLNENPEFPLSTIIKLQNLRTLNINYNNYQTIEPYVFQQMKQLATIYMNNPFTCDCNLQWASIIKQFGVYIRNSYCLDPVDTFGRSITNEDSYTNCTRTQSYQCFDKSISCENNEVCHNTESGYSCGCPIGYELNKIGHCGDIDECDEANQCQHSCVNTDGTFYCACNVGYRLSDNGYDCEDINECQEGIEECEYGCKNTIGSYQCYCEVGHQLYNETNCNNDFQCELVGNSYDPLNCIDEGESVLSCNSGLNFSIINLPCVSSVVSTTCKVPESTQELTVSASQKSEASTSTQQTTIASLLSNSEWANPSLILLIIPFIIVGVQTIVIIILIVCILKRNKSLKNNVTAPAIHQPSLPNNPTVQSRHGMFNQMYEKENPEEISSPLPKANQMPSNITFAELYPGEGSMYTTMN